MDPPVRSGTGDSAAFFGNDNALSRRPKVPHGTQRRHLRLILSPKGAVRHSKAALTAYSVAQRCRAVLKGGTYGLFCRPKVPAVLKGDTYGLFCRPKVPAVLKGDTYGLFCRPKVPCGTQRRHLRPILSPKGAVRHSKATLTAYSVAQRCRTVLKGGTYGDFSSPESTATNYPVSRTRRSAHETTLADSFVSRTRRLAHETTSADPPVSRTRLFTHETTSELSCATGTLRALLNAAEVRPEPVRLIERLGAFRDGDLDG